MQLRLLRNVRRMARMMKMRQEWARAPRRASIRRLLNPKTDGSAGAGQPAIAFKSMGAIGGLCLERELESALGESLRPAEQRLP